MVSVLRLGHAGITHIAVKVVAGLPPQTNLAFIAVLDIRFRVILVDLAGRTLLFCEFDAALTTLFGGRLHPLAFAAANLFDDSLDQLRIRTDLLVILDALLCGEQS